jgi:protein-disulfide isomerase
MTDEENKNLNENQETPKDQHSEKNNDTSENSGEEENSGGFKPSKGMIIGGLIVFVIILFAAQEYIHFGDKDHKGPHDTNKGDSHKQVKPATVAPKLPAPASSPRTNAVHSSVHSGDSIVPENSPMPSHKQNKKDIEKIIGQYIENNPEIVAKALQNLNAKMDKQREGNTKNYLKNNMNKITESKIYLGNPNGKNIIVEFFDYKCSYCRRSHLVMERVMKEYPSVKLVLLPIPMLGKNSAEAVRGAAAVWNLSRKHFSDFHESLINSPSIDDNTISTIAAKLGISSESLAKEMKSPEIQKMIDENLGIAQHAGVRGVPTFIIGGELVPGSLSYEGFKEILDRRSLKQ